MRWRAFLNDGRYPIDNNPAENAIRAIAIGRKNWLFCGSESAGQRAAAIMSLLATAKANGLDPYAWLVNVLTRLPTTLDKHLDSLLPPNWHCPVGQAAIAVQGVVTGRLHLSHLGRAVVNRLTGCPRNGGGFMLSRHNAAHGTAARGARQSTNQAAEPIL